MSATFRQSFHRNLSFRKLHIFLVSVLLGLLPLAGPIHGAAGCSSPVPLVPGETWRDPGGGIGLAACFQVELDRAGFLMADLAVIPGEPGARLSIRGGEPLRRVSGHQLRWVPPGSHLLRVDAEDPRGPLAPFRLRVGFATPIGTSRSETDSELEVEPDPVIGGGLVGLGGTFARSETDSELEVEPDPVVVPGGAGKDPHDLSLPFVALRPDLSELCGSEEGDDHGDGFLCATPIPLGEVLQAELGNGWGDDVDLFRFDLPAFGTVEIQAGTASGAQLDVALFDRHGLRLSDSGGSIGGRQVRTMVPGTYFLRVEARGGGIAQYDLVVDSQP
ncbi:MAG: PPC domain-containing protein [Acidobacteriota bacterium]